MLRATRTLSTASRLKKSAMPMISSTRWVLA
jgi:hypothetical protein